MEGTGTQAVSRLESVWKAAAENEYCDAGVIPIPYYDKIQTGVIIFFETVAEYILGEMGGLGI